MNKTYLTKTVKVGLMLVITIIFGMVLEKANFCYPLYEKLFDSVGVILIAGGIWGILVCLTMVIISTIEQK